LDNFSQEKNFFIDSVTINVSVLFMGVSVIFFMLALSYKSKYIMRLDYPSRIKSKKGTIKLGKIMHNNRLKHAFFLNVKDLAQHMFICGITGQGKSNFLQYFLLNFTKKNNTPFLLTEFKGEYHFLQNKITNLIVIKPGENFSINVFDPEGADPQVHAERVYQIFESGGLLEGVEYSPQMERVFVDILNQVCLNLENRNWEMFDEICVQYLKDQKDMTIQKSIYAVQNRIRRYSLGTLKDIFVKKTGLNVKELFRYNVLLDLSSIIRLGGEKEDALFFLNMILKYLWDKNISYGSKNYKGFKHITIIEDAQYFTPQEMSERTKLTSYIEDIALLLRGTGECLISLATRPNISREILANCGVLISFQNHMQKDLMQELLNLDENQKEYLSMLQTGQCIIRINSIEKPFALQIPYVERSWLTDEEILRNNEKIIKNEFSKNSYRPSPEIFKNNDLNIKTYCEYCGGEIEKNSSHCKACSTELGKKDEEFEELKALIKNLVD
jgi:hypothetical protein